MRVLYGDDNGLTLNPSSKAEEKHVLHVAWWFNHNVQTHSCRN